MVVNWIADELRFGLKCGLFLYVIIASLFSLAGLSITLSSRLELKKVFTNMRTQRLINSQRINFIYLLFAYLN